VLHLTSLSSSPDILKILLEGNADVNLQDKDDQTALHLAALSSLPDILKKAS
jgi:ankyrin repeat protein